MTMDIEYDASIHCIVINAIGKIEYADLQVLAKDLIEHTEFRTNINQIFNCSDAELNLTIDDLRRVAEDFTKIEEILGLERKLALVVSRDVEFGQMRQYEVFFQSGPNVMIHVFRSLDAARRWIAN